MFNKYATPLYLEIRYPWYCRWTLLLIHAAGLLALLILQWPVELRISMGLLCFLGLRWSLGPLLQARHPGRVQRAAWGPGDEWHLWFADGRNRTARLEPDFFQQAGITQLRLHDARLGRVTLLLLPGMLPDESQRRLRVRLRLFAHAHEGMADTASTEGHGKG